MNQKYSPEQVEKALAVFMANGGNYLKTAKEVGIPYGTLRTFVEKSPFVQRVLTTKKKKFIAEAWRTMFTALRKANKLLNSKSVEQDITVSQIATLISTLYEKQALAACEPTSRTQHDETRRTISDETRRIISEQKSADDQGTDTLKVIPLTRAG